MGTFGQLLRDGLRLAVLRKPRRIPLDAGFGHFFGFVLIACGIDAAFEWPLVEAPRVFELQSLQSMLADGLLQLAAAALLCAVAGRRAVFWAVAAWLAVLAIPLNIGLGALYLADRHVASMPVAFYAFFVALAWLFVAMIRLGATLAGRPAWRGASAGVLATVLMVAPWFVLQGWDYWRTDFADESFEPAPDPGTLPHPEAAMYAQGALLERALDALAPEREDRSDLYSILFAGDAGEDVFRNEVEFAQRLLESRADAGGRVLALVNHPDGADRRPLATATNLERALRRVADRMNVEEDILFLYLTSHGSPDHQLYVNQPPLPLDQLTPQRLRRALDRAGVRWRVLVVSACYSGGYVEALRDPRTLVITASRADRSSFGCGADSDITWFGDAFLAHALNETVDFTDAFARAKALIAQWEREEEFEASDPQIEEGEEIGARLRAWREGFAPGPRVEFTPPDD